MTEKNPFTLSFARFPSEYIPRISQTSRIIDTFTLPPVTDQVFIIKGIRGTGKTVLMNSVYADLEKRKDWVATKIISRDHILSAMYSNLYYSKKLFPARIKPADLKISVSSGIFTAGAEARKSSGAPEPNLVESIRRLLMTAQKKKKNVLVCIDEISNTPQMAAFSSALQSYIGDCLPVYFIGTGIYENIEELRNVKDLTFLYRAPSIELTPLDFASIAESYRRVFSINSEEAVKMANITKGYSFAYQSLGYVYWERRNSETLDEMMPELDHILADGAYNKIWEELSANDKKTASAIAENEGKRTIEIRTEAGMDSNVFSTYQNRLKQKGLLDTKNYGYVSFALPRFSVFVKNKMIGY